MASKSIDMAGNSHRSTLRVTSLPEEIRETARKLDYNDTGELGSVEIRQAFGDLHNTKKKNKNLKYMIIFFVLITILLTGAVFGASITAARLAKDTEVDRNNGFAYLKGTHNVMKTSEALEWNQEDIGQLSNEKLTNIEDLVFSNGDISFKVKGHARDIPGETVQILVEGGTILYDKDGIIDATGDAKLLLERRYGSDLFVAGSEGNRRLQAGSNPPPSFGTNSMGKSRGKQPTRPSF